MKIFRILAVASLLISSPLFAQNQTTRSPNQKLQEFLIGGEHLIFVGTREDFDRFDNDLTRSGFNIVRYSMFNEIVGSSEVISKMVGHYKGMGFDDNGDGFIDNAYGWDFVSNQPFDPTFSDLPIYEDGRNSHIKNPNDIAVYGIIIPDDSNKAKRRAIAVAIVDLTIALAMLENSNFVRSPPIAVANKKMHLTLLQQIESSPRLNLSGVPILFETLAY